LKQGAGKLYPCDATQRRLCMLDFTVYLLYRAGSAIASIFPLRFLFILGQCLGFCAWIVLGKYRRLAERNVTIAFGREKSPHPGCVDRCRSLYNRPGAMAYGFHGAL